MTPSSPARTPRRRNGFTLVEVLAALMILAVGLLALEALGIGAARMVARAERLSEYNTHAVSRLEETLSEIRLYGTATGATETLQGASMVTSLTSGNGRSWTVRVSVLPTGDRVLAASDSFSVTGHVLVE